MRFFDELTKQIQDVSSHLSNTIQQKSEKLADSTEKLDKQLTKEIKKEQKLQAEAEYQKIIAKFENNKAYKQGIYYFDSVDNRMLIGKTLFRRYYTIINYSDIVSCEINQREHSNIKTTTKKKHGVARAVTGGILFGGAGAVVGGITGKNKSISSTENFIDHLGLIITLKNGNSFEIPFITTATKTNSFVVKSSYNQLQKVKGLIDAGINKSQTTVSDNLPSTSSLDEIKKLKELLDIGAITEEEFQAKKKQLLNL